MFVISRSFLIKDTLLFFYIQLYSHRVVASTYTPAGYTFEGYHCRHEPSKVACNTEPPLYCKNDQNKKVIYYEDLNFTIKLNGGGGDIHRTNRPPYRLNHANE